MSVGTINVNAVYPEPWRFLNFRGGFAFKSNTECKFFFIEKISSKIKL